MDPLHSLSATWTGSPTLNQARLTDAGQSAWNLRVTCPRRPPLRLNHRLPPPSLTSSSTCQPPPPPLLPSCSLPSRTRNIYGGGWFWFSGICRCHRRRSLPFATRRYTLPSSLSNVALSLSLSLHLAGWDGPPSLINGPAHFARSDATKNYTLLNTDELLAGTGRCHVILFAYVSPLWPRWYVSSVLVILFIHFLVFFFRLVAPFAK